MLKDTFLDEIKGTAPRPNKFTIGMGKMIKSAREEAGLNQRELAEKIYRRQAALSDMENGKMEPDASTLLLLSYHLSKSLAYFFPDGFKPLGNLEIFSQEEQELMLHAKRMEKNDLLKLIAQVKALADYSKKDM